MPGADGITAGLARWGHGSAGTRPGILTGRARGNSARTPPGPRPQRQACKTGSHPKVRRRSRTARTNPRTPPHRRPGPSAGSGPRPATTRTGRDFHATPTIPPGLKRAGKRYHDIFQGADLLSRPRCRWATAEGERAAARGKRSRRLTAPPLRTIGVARPAVVHRAATTWPHAVVVSVPDPGRGTQLPRGGSAGARPHLAAVAGNCASGWTCGGLCRDELTGVGRPHSTAGIIRGRAWFGVSCRGPRPVRGGAATPARRSHGA